MRQLAVAGVLAAIFALAVLSPQPTAVHACSPGADFDPIAQAAVVVTGRLTNWEAIPTSEERSFQTIRVHMQVDRVYKGPPGLNQLSFIESASLDAHREGQEQRWAGSSGACGTFNFDPTGVYAVMALILDDDGNYRSSGPRTFFLGGEPGGETYDRALARMLSFPAAAGLPALGSGPAPASATNHLLIAAAAAAAGVALAGAAWFARRRATT